MSNRIQLTTNIFLDEFTHSETAIRHGIDISIEEGSQEFDNCKRLATTILQPVRNEFKRPVIIQSGYRPPELNKLIRGSQTSAHKEALAVDFNVLGVPPAIVCEWMIRQKFSWDQLILEYGSWTHVGLKLDPTDHREQVLTAQQVPNKHGGKPKTKYVVGLV